MRLGRGEGMSLDNKAIEILAVNAVKNSIVTSEYLDQFIAENDKEPTWDGFVYIYNDKSKKKSKLEGRMPVQIKGTECDEQSKEIISYSMKTTDLRNYLHDGGCVLFVVYIGNSGLTNKIYYKELTPIKLRQILNDAKNQANKTIHLKVFPMESNEKATIFLNCFQNCKKQASFGEGKLFTLEELEAQGILENVVVPISGVGIKDPQMALIKNDVYLYAKIKGSTIPQPLDFVPYDIHTQEIIDADITIGDRLFYTNYEIIKSAEDIILCIGESFKIRFTEQSRQGKIKYKNSQKFRVLAKDLDFMLAYIENGYFKIKDIKIPLDYTGMAVSNFDIDKEKEQLKYIQKVIRVLDILNCPDDIDVSVLDKEDWRNLNRLIMAFLEQKPISGLKNDLPPIICIKVGKLRFALCVKSCGEKGTYEITDFFKAECSFAFEGRKKDEMLPISQYAILHDEDFLTLSNIDFDAILPSFQKVVHHYETFNRANWFLLELLNAYDKATGWRKEKIMKVCKEFCLWIQDAPVDELDPDVKTLNILQTTKRWRALTLDEIGSLYAMIERVNVREDCLVGAYLLLDQQYVAQLHYNKLTEEEQNNFKTYPIYHFWKTEDTKNG